MYYNPKQEDEIFCPECVKPIKKMYKLSGINNEEVKQEKNFKNCNYKRK